MNDPRPTSEDSWTATKRAFKLVGNSSRDTMDGELARHTLHVDLGSFSDSAPHNYYLDEDTRDRLIAHARQDAAHAVILASRGIHEGRLIRWIGLAILVCLILLLLKP